MRRGLESAGGLVLSIFCALILVASFAEYQRQDLYEWMALEWLVGCAAAIVGIAAGINIIVRGSTQRGMPWSRSREG